MGMVGTFLKNSGIFVVGAALSKLIAFAMLPLYTLMIPPADFGYFDLSLTYLTVITEPLFLNIWVVILRRMYQEKGQEIRAVQAGSLVFLISSGCYALLVALSALVLDIPHIGLIALLGIAQNIGHVYKHASRGMRRNWDYALSGVIASVVLMGVNVALLVGLRWDVRALYVAAIAASLSEVAYLEMRIHLVRWMRSAEWGWGIPQAAKAMFFLAIPIGLNALVYWSINSLSRAAVGALLGFAASGIFAVAMRFGAAMMLVIMATTYAWQDLAFERSKEDAAFFGRAAAGYAMALLTGLALLLPAFRLAFPWVVDARYTAALPVIPCALAVSALSGYSNFLVNIFYAIGRNRDTLWAIGAAGVVNMAAILPLIELWGLVGASLSTMIGYSAGIGFMLYRLFREIGMPVAPRGPLAGLALVCGTAGVFAYGNTLANAVALGVVLVVAAIGATRMVQRK
ncbi:MAG: polysaccharide biosynthesis C-terminal domain-containing protein [Propionibacteriaceae bacterium]|nr:polysaccharide biosynthesis C-terminal domain-containing protein [Propionibacteriaceae bacterium]